MIQVESKNAVPAEWSAQAALWAAWPSHENLWGELLGPARSEVAQMIAAVAQGQKVKLLAMGDEAIASAEELVGAAAEIIPAKFGDIWLRDTGPIFSGSGDALRFKTNGWGGKYDLPFDDVIGDEIAKLADAPIVRHDFVLEGGAVEHNGAGSILTTRQCMLNPNRNADWDEARANEALRHAFGAEEIFWLDEGLKNDHTDGHIDNVARFVGERKVACQRPFGDGDPNAKLYEKTIRDLKEFGFEVAEIPSPGLVLDGEGEIAPASHMNFVITNKTVVVPIYDTESAAEAVEAIACLFPERDTVGLPSDAILSGGGSFHCMTQQEPLNER